MILASFSFITVDCCSSINVSSFSLSLICFNNSWTWLSNKSLKIKTVQNFRLELQVTVTRNLSDPWKPRVLWYICTYILSEETWDFRRAPSRSSFIEVHSDDLEASSVVRVIPLVFSSSKAVVSRVSSWSISIFSLGIAISETDKISYKFHHYCW